MRHAPPLLAAAALASGARPAATDTSRLRAEAVRHAPRPATRAERSAYRETSRHADVLAFLDTLTAMDGRLFRTTLGRSSEGREIPLVVASRPRVTTPAQARALGRPIVWVQGNIHAGEVEGKEALQMLLRDLALDPKPNVLDSLVLLAVPIYNADGNEKVGPQARQRGAQNGPEEVGQRPNAMGLDLNRDYIKAEAPETRASLAAFAQWDPDAFVDLHTTNGSYHGYQLTWSPSLHPAAPLRAFNQDTLLPALQRRVRERWGVPTFPYGNFAQDEGIADTTKKGWLTYDHRPRFGTNYYGLRGKLSILSEAYSHDPFDVRVRATYAFVRELLSQLVDERAHARVAAPRPPAEGVLRAALDERAPAGDVIAEDLVRTGDSSRTQPGVPLGMRRTGRFRTVRIPVVDRFVATRTARIPAGGWLLDPSVPGVDSVLALLRRHGVEARHTPGDVPFDVEVFTVDSVVRAARPFQGHREVRLEGRWRRERRTPVYGAWFVRPAQKHALLALQLLEPESDDGLATWNLLDGALAPGKEYPVVRIHGTGR
ncbi:M14 family metallopeptidase [Roseisolibacter sp. H3M3-2]|uniref:M14 family metallopeptidase n=1 Tax=Roseisolibacter sp. H3M3-2 TaxID=3031323 RepID=UPI0023DC6F81|nr:M14 family metallopeptidase [Roseisolibacter sp. H3M3-2]MDF1505102.1 M14 family metallopeptidase [Roseisolibacter sp. H3M3-2]